MRAGLVVVVDLALVLVFAAVGRVSHGERLTAGGLALTAWPFVAGSVVGWALAAVLATVGSRPWRSLLSMVPGVLVWVSTVVAGMLLRRVTGAGVQASFVVVATVVLGVFLLGWRAVVSLALRVRRRARGRAAQVSLD